MPDDEAIRRRIDTRQRALIENDRATMEGLLHPHYFYINDQGQSYDKQQFLDNLFNQGGTHHISRWPSMFSLEIEDMVATVGYEVRGKFLIAGRQHDGLYQIYHTLIKVEGEWVFIAGHIALAP